VYNVTGKDDNETRKNRLWLAGSPLPGGRSPVWSLSL
jgi:hypothetical protein